MAAYRYTLRREVAEPITAGGLEVCWIMLNPSTADDEADDPTIRRVIRFSRDAGYARLIVVNRFAARATAPGDLAYYNDPAGPDNAEHLRRAASAADAIVYAWGNSIDAVRAHPSPLPPTFGKEPLCLGITKRQQPRHPLYVAANQPLIPYQPRSA